MWEKWNMYCVQILIVEIYKYLEIFLRIGLQVENGFPVSPVGQLQIGLWLYTRQIAPTPHTPRQGSWHFWFEHASFKLQSELIVHSGLQDGGTPK